RDASTGEIEEWARIIVEAVDSYTEVSPSGTGLHIFVRGVLPPGDRKRGPIEMYSEKRFLTVTGLWLEGAPAVVTERRRSVEVLHASVFGERAGRAPQPSRRVQTSVAMSDEDVLAKLYRARNAARFQALWGGSDEGYPSPSEADAALCSMIAFYTQDPAQIERIVRRSARPRDKWLTHRDYLQRTIARALDNLNEVYSPPRALSAGSGGLVTNPIGDGAVNELISRVNEPDSLTEWLTSSSVMGSRASNPRWNPVPLDELHAGDDEGTAWLFGGYLARGMITSFTAIWKGGKTTLLSHLFKAMDGSATEFLGQPVSKAKILVVTEENKRHWERRQADLGIGGHVHMMCMPFIMRPSPTEWIEFMKHISWLVKEHHYDLVVFDTTHNLWGVQNEQDGPQAQAALMPMYMLTEQGAAVLLLFHPTKGDTSEGKLTRGSGAIGGLVDIIVEMRRFDAERRGDTRRVLTSYSRFEETPPEIVIELDKATHTYSLVGTKGEANSAERIQVILDMLPSEPPGLTVRELCEHWPEPGPGTTSGDAVGPKSHERSLRRDLEHAARQNLVRKQGTGLKNNPVRYYR
ncbi:MAG: AAA family ATPase, partial [Chloroflexia bacterium]